MMTAVRRVKSRRTRDDGLTEAVIRSFALSLACFISYLLTTRVLTEVHALSSVDDLLGGVWAVIATVFVYRTSDHEGVMAARSRIGATLVSFALCFVYLLIFPFHPLGLVVLIGIGTLILTVIGRPGEIITADITTAVVIVVAAIDPHDAWQQPILRLADTAIGVVVGLAAASAESSLRTALRVSPRSVSN